MHTPYFDILMSAYFHQDWDLDHETEADVLAAFLATHPGDALADEIAAILGEFDSEPDLKAYSIDRDRPATGPNDGETFRAWLTRLMETARASAG